MFHPGGGEAGAGDLDELGHSVGGHVDLESAVGFVEGEVGDVDTVGAAPEEIRGERLGGLGVHGIGDGRRCAAERAVDDLPHPGRGVHAVPMRVTPWPEAAGGRESFVDPQRVHEAGGVDGVGIAVVVDGLPLLPGDAEADERGVQLVYGEIANGVGGGFVVGPDDVRGIAAETPDGLVEGGHVDGDVSRQEQTGFERFTDREALTGFEQDWPSVGTCFNDISGVPRTHCHRQCT